MSYYNDFEKDFANRTLLNFKYANEHRKEGLFEVTQLLNSAIGIIVWIKESELFDDELLRISMQDIDKEAWGFPEILKNNGKKDLYNVVYHMRNAFAHKNIKIIEYETNIIAIDLWSKDEDGNIVVKYRFTINNLEKFFCKMVAFINDN